VNDGFRFPIFLSPAASTNVLLITEIIYSRKFCKNIEALFNNLRSFIQGSPIFRRTEPSPRKPATHTRWT